MIDGPGSRGCRIFGSRYDTNHYNSTGSDTAATLWYNVIQGTKDKGNSHDPDRHVSLSPHAGPGL
jgi:hypothetical protein